MRGDRVRRPASREVRERALERLRDVGLNFTPPANGADPGEGWRIDDYCVALPSEPPGLPVPAGPWQLACRALAEYAMADPAIVRATWDAESPLEGRTMLLEGRFYWMRFYLGVRVNRVVDEVRSVHGDEVRVWGWSYRTLEGHLEQGQMDYEIWKRISSGEVEFRIHAYSKSADIRNPIVRLGFALFGRHMQKRFARRALERVDGFVRDELASVSWPR